MLSDIRLTETMTTEEIRLLRERPRQSGSNPFLIMLIFAGLIACLVSMGSQSSQRTGQDTSRPSALSGLFSK